MKKSQNHQHISDQYYKKLFDIKIKIDSEIYLK
jgi:hypothetical protein